MNKLEKLHEEVKKLEEHYEDCRDKAMEKNNLHGMMIHSAEAGAFELAISALEQQLTNGWIPVSERLPVSEERVLICADRKFQDGNTIQITAVAMYEDGTMHTNDSGFMWEEDIDFEYDEETDDFIIPEGWWEQSMYCEEFGKVDDFVTHWQPLPEPYKEVPDAERVKEMSFMWRRYKING